MKQKEYFVWCDALRLLAFFFLFCCHAADPFYAAATYAASGVTVDPELVQWGTRWGSFVRPCVPLFVMLTGVLLLPVKSEMFSFYKKRIPRVLFPFLLWSVVYYLTPWMTGVLGFESGVVYKLFSWAETDSQTFVNGMMNVLRIPYAFSFVACHMWYIYMLIGLYLYLPIFSSWVESATKRQKEFVLLLWGVSTFLPYFNEFVSQYAFGTCEWNSFGLFYYFAGFSGYMLLGHYIKSYISWSRKKIFFVSIPLLVIGYLITFSGYSYVMSLSEKTPEMLELFWTYNTPNVLIMSVACFLLLYRVRIAEGSLFARLLANLTSCGFGIYMIHYFFVYLGYKVGELIAIPAALRIPFSAVIILLTSWAIVFIGKMVLGKCSKYVFG